MPLNQTKKLQGKNIDFLNWTCKISDLKRKSLSFSSSVENVDKNAPLFLFF